MSKKTQEKKEAKAKGKQAKIAKANAKKAAAPKEEAKPKQSIKNYGKCRTCKSYKRCHGLPQPCPITGKYTAKNATCGSYGYKG